MTPLRRPSTAVIAAAGAGAAAGVVMTVIVVAAWPESSDDVGATTAGAVVTPTVPPPPPITDLPETTQEPTAPSPTSSDESSWEDGSEGSAGTEPKDAPPLPNAAPAGEGPLPDYSAVSCPTSTVPVTSADALTVALSNATPGDVIAMAPGSYAGNFAITTSGTEQEPIWLCGSADSVIDGGDIEGDYAVHLENVSHWRLVGFTVTGGQKGIVADTTAESVIQGLRVSGTGDEAIHLRTNSTFNVVQGNTITDTGLRRDTYGEGVYIGSAVSNWCTYNACEADRSDYNVVVANTISDTGSESIDIKEGTTGGLVLDNTFDGASMTGADSWVDVKGNNYLIQANTGVSAPEDGFQTHQILDGWGDFNVFDGNHADVGGPGNAISSWPPESNVVHCNNTVANAADGLSNIPCS